MNLIDITPALSEPFALEHIDFLPKNNFERDGQTLVLALPFADPRTYQDRLNQVVPGEWTSRTEMIVATGKMVAVVTITICGIEHSDVGEAALTSENAATEAFAQGFKRACSQFGLGRYLYDLDKAYVPYDKVKKRITLDATGLKAEARKLYVKAGLLLPERTGRSDAQHPQAAPTPTTQHQAVQSSRPEPASPAGSTGPVTEPQRTSIAKLCKGLGNKKVALPANYQAAKELIAQLAQEYKERRKVAS